MKSSGVPQHVFMDEALRIVEEAERRGIILRLLGSIAVRLHCPAFGSLYESADRPLTDIDYISYGEFNPKMRDFFGGLGYSVDKSVLRYYGRFRHIYWHDEYEGLHVDIFFDKLRFCHEIDFTGRLELDYPTITVSDMLLEKMQIVEINLKDLKDTAILLREHQIDVGTSGGVDYGYIAEILSSDWGFYHTVQTNLGKLSRFCETFGPFSEQDKTVVKDRIGDLMSRLEKEPKSLRWKVRSRIGTKVQWYQDVEEVVR